MLSEGLGVTARGLPTCRRLATVEATVTALKAVLAEAEGTVQTSRQAEPARTDFGRCGVDWVNALGSCVFGTLLAACACCAPDGLS